MLYDYPELISEEEDREIKKRFSWVAAKGTFRVIGIDICDDDYWVVGDFDTFEEARKCADERTNSLQMMIVNDDTHTCYKTKTFF